MPGVGLRLAFGVEAWQIPVDRIGKAALLFSEMI
jgi:hypothetical protein